MWLLLLQLLVLPLQLLCMLLFLLELLEKLLMLIPVLHQVDAVVVRLPDQSLGLQTFDNLVDGIVVLFLSSEFGKLSLHCTEPLHLLLDVPDSFHLSKLFLLDLLLCPSPLCPSLHQIVGIAFHH